ncbi:MAG: glycoside hydrolase family 68 protein, partial [Pontixanthobacter sp.]
MTSIWTPDHVSVIPGRADYPSVPLITQEQAKPLIPGVVLWDMWPVQSPDGTIPSIADGDLWMALSAPDRRDPARRHFEAKIRLLHRGPHGVRDLGDVLPDFGSFYEREWAGSAVLKGDRVTLYFTAAGLSAAPGGYQQKLVETTGRLKPDGRIADWSVPVESMASDGRHYMHVDQADGEPGKIKAFRDPAYFCDPADDSEYLIFTASLASSCSDHNGAVGLARKSVVGSWELLPP